MTRKRKDAAPPPPEPAADPSPPDFTTRESLTLPGDDALGGDADGLGAAAESLDEAPKPDPDDPLAALNADNYSADTESGPASDLAVVESAFAKRAKQEARRFAVVTDSEYWACLFFDTREQKQAFLKALGWDKLGADKYLDGVALAARLGVPLPPSPPELVFAREKADPKLSSLTL